MPGPKYITNFKALGGTFVATIGAGRSNGKTTSWFDLWRDGEQITIVDSLGFTGRYTIHMVGRLAVEGNFWAKNVVVALTDPSVSPNART